MKIIKLFLLSILLCSCYKLEYSKIEYEKGKVFYKKFIPAHYETSFYTDSEGNRKIDRDYISEKYILKFQCQHDKIFQISQENAKMLWTELEEYDNVIIIYRTVDRVYEKEGKEVNREFHDFDFITAKKEKFTPEN